jgi:hypothetical protein
VPWRAGIIAYFLLYEWLFPAIAAMGKTDADSLFAARVSMRLVHVLLICWPLLFYRRQFGFLHPLILPTLFGMLKQIAEFPLALIAPFSLPLFDYDVSSSSSAVAIQSLSHSALAWTRLEYEGAQSLALACYYAGYFFLRRSGGPNIRFHTPRNVGRVCFGATTACALVAVYFIQTHGGGLSNLLVAMRGGRHQLFQGLGQFLQIADFAVVPALVWFAHERKAFRNPWWLIALVAGSLAAILTSGSRSSVVGPLIVLMFLWWRKAGRVLIVPSVVLAVAALIVVGTFGAIRQDYGSQTVNTSALSVGALGGNLTRARAEFKSRAAEEPGLAAFAGARNGLLWGRTYVGAVAFFVPRALWPGKPHSADAYNMGVNFEGRSIDTYDAGTVWGIPVGPVEEAFWNFSLPGVVIAFFLLGMLHRWLSRLVWANPTTPAALILAVWIALNFTGTSLSFVNTARDVIMLSALYYALGVWRPRALELGAPGARRRSWPQYRPHTETTR